MSHKFINLAKKSLQSGNGISLDAVRMYKSVRPSFNVVSLEGRNTPLYWTVVSLEEEEKKEKEEEKTGIWAKIKGFFKKIWELIKRAFNWVIGLFKKKEVKDFAKRVDDEVKKNNNKLRLPVYVLKSDEDKAEDADKKVKIKADTFNKLASTETSKSILMSKTIDILKIMEEYVKRIEYLDGMMFKKENTYSKKILELSKDPNANSMNVFNTFGSQIGNHIIGRLNVNFSNNDYAQNQWTLTYTASDIVISAPKMEENFNKVEKSAKTLADDVEKLFKDLERNLSNVKVEGNKGKAEKVANDIKSIIKLLNSTSSEITAGSASFLTVTKAIYDNLNLATKDEENKEEEKKD